MIRGIAWGRAVLIALASVLGGALLAWATAASLPYHAPEAARLRLSWTARPERIETCRKLSDEELAARPPHMRQRLECTGGFASYSLRVEVDGTVAGDLTVLAGGFRHDRPIHLLREFAIPTGAHRLRVTFTQREPASSDTTASRRDTIASEALEPGEAEAADTGLYAGRAEREAGERARKARAALPPRLELDTSLQILPGKVVLVTFNPDRRALELRTRMAAVVRE